MSKLREKTGQLVVAIKPWSKAQAIGSSEMMHLTKRLFEDECGQDMIEYALVTAAIGFGCIAAIGGIANPVVNAYYSVTNNFTNGV